MKLIVESGATKTAWRAVCEDGSVRSVQTDGLSPTCLDLEHTRAIVRKAVPELNPEGRRVDQIFFYGAGLVSEESATPVRDALEMWCPMAAIEFHSDITAAARALFGDGNGVWQLWEQARIAVFMRLGKLCGTSDRVGTYLEMRGVGLHWAGPFLQIL